MQAAMRVVFVAGILLSATFVSGDDASAKLEEAYKLARQDFRDAETTDAKLEIAKGFLDEFPASEHTVEVADMIFYFQGVEQGDMKGAIAYTRKIRKKISDAQIATDLDVKLGQMFSKAGRADDFTAIGERLAVSDRLSFTQHIDLIKAAVEVGSWDIVKTSCATARRFANPDAYRADYPSNVISDEEAEARAQNRLGMILIYQGWAKANTGRPAEALEDFAAADGLVTKNVVGVSNDPLDTYWGKTLMLQGRYREAFERLAVEALIVGNEEAHDALLESYVAFNGSEKGFDDYASSYQKKAAKTIDDFSLPGFSEGRYSLGDLKGDVTLICFWHPT
jgi:tetratricopeptide (TPR) repeat protein